MVESFFPFEQPIKDGYSGRYSRLITCVERCEDPSSLCLMDNPEILKVREQLFDVLLGTNFEFIHPFLQSNSFFVSHISLSGMDKHEAECYLMDLAGFRYPDLKEVTQTPFVVVGAAEIQIHSLKEEFRQLLVDAFGIYFQTTYAQDGRGLVILGDVSMWPRKTN